MKNLGLYLAIFGIGSVVLSLVDMNFRAIMWIDNWGESIGWSIRGGASVIGIILFSVGLLQESNKNTEEA